MTLINRVALPLAASMFVWLAVLVPAWRVKRRTGVWPIVVATSQAPGQRMWGWLIRVAGLAVGGWLVGYAVAGPEAVGVIALPPELARTSTLAGWTLTVGAFLLLVMAQAQMGASWRIGIDERATALVTHGLYGVVRNPIYTAMDLMLAGIVAIAPSPWTLAAALATALALAVQTRFEERHLASLHGPTYRVYAARVGRFVPGIGRFRD